MLNRAQRRTSIGGVPSTLGDENATPLLSKAMGKIQTNVAVTGKATKCGELSKVRKQSGLQPPNVHAPIQHETHQQNQQQRALRRLSMSAVANSANTNGQQNANDSGSKAKKASLLKEPKNYPQSKPITTETVNQPQTRERNDRRMTFSVPSMKNTVATFEHTANSNDPPLPDCFTLDRNEFEMEFERSAVTRRQSLAPTAFAKCGESETQFQEAIVGSECKADETVAVGSAVESMLDDLSSLLSSSKKRKSLSPSHALGQSTTFQVAAPTETAQTQLATENENELCGLRVHPEENPIRMEDENSKSKEHNNGNTNSSAPSATTSTESVAMPNTVAAGEVQGSPVDSVAERIKRRKFSPAKGKDSQTAANATAGFTANDFEWLSEQMMELEKQVMELTRKCASLSTELCAERTAKISAEQNLSSAREYSKYCEDVIVQRESRIEELRKQLDSAQHSHSSQTAKDEHVEQLQSAQKEINSLQQENDSLREENRRMRKERHNENTHTSPSSFSGSSTNVQEEEFHSATAFFAENSGTLLDSSSHFSQNKLKADQSQSQSNCYQKNRRHSLSSAEVLAALQDQANDNENGQAAEQSRNGQTVAKCTRQSVGGAPSQNDNPNQNTTQTRAQRRMTLSSIQLTNADEGHAVGGAARRLSLSNADRCSSSNESSNASASSLPPWALDGCCVKVRLPRSHSCNSDDAIRTVCRKYLRASSAIERVHFGSDNNVGCAVLIQCSDSSSAIYLSQCLTKKDKWDAKYVKKMQL